MKSVRKTNVSTWLKGIFSRRLACRDMTMPVDEIDIEGVTDFSTLTLSRRYRRKHVLGHGGFGVVFLAEDKFLGRHVAVKQFHKPEDKESAMYKLFLQEARLAASLNHPNCGFQNKWTAFREFMDSFRSEATL